MRANGRTVSARVRPGRILIVRVVMRCASDEIRTWERHAWVARHWSRS
jgi:hypothetical protein